MLLKISCQSVLNHGFPLSPSKKLKDDKGTEPYLSMSNLGCFRLAL